MVNISHRHLHTHAVTLLPVSLIPSLTYLLPLPYLPPPPPLPTSSPSLTYLLPLPHLSHPPPLPTSSPPSPTSSPSLTCLLSLPYPNLSIQHLGKLLLPALFTLPPSMCKGVSHITTLLVLLIEVAQFKAFTLPPNSSPYLASSPGPMHARTFANGHQALFSTPII